MKDKGRESMLDLWQLCESCAANVHGKTPPTVEYADRVARQLFGTCMIESGCGKWRRQIGYHHAPQSYKGAFGLFQTELGSVETSVAWLDHHHDVRGRIEHWTEAHYGLLTMLDVNAAKALVGMVQHEDADALSCALARLHYLRKPEPIPDSLDDQAAYWLEHYNGYGACKKWERKGHTRIRAMELALIEYKEAFERGWKAVAA